MISERKNAREIVSNFALLYESARVIVTQSETGGRFK